jgi:hypothetical protein
MPFSFAHILDLFSVSNGPKSKVKKTLCASFVSFVSW